MSMPHELPASSEARTAESSGTQSGGMRWRLISTGLVLCLCVGGMELGLPRPTAARSGAGGPAASAQEQPSRERISAAALPIPGQVVVDPANPRWLMFNGGGPFYLCAPGDPEGFLYRGTRNADGTRNGDQEALIDKLAGTGANGIYMMAVRSHGGDGDATENPFVDSDPALGLDADILDQWGGWFTELDRQGIVAFLFFYDDGAGIWNTGDSVGPEEQAFLRGIVDRFEHHTHLIWVVAEEYSEAYSAQRVSNIAAEIRAADDHDHPIAVHKLNGLSFSELADDPSIDQFAIQFSAPGADGFHAAVVSAWNASAGRYNLNLAEGHPDVFGTEARLRSWAVAMAGGYIMHLRWDIANSSVSDLEDCGRLVSFLQATAFHQMAPHDELAFGGTGYVLASPGLEYIAYAPDLSGEMGLQDLPSGTYTLTWLDIPSGTVVTQTGLSLPDGDQSWTRPAGIGTEVAVHVHRTGPLPGVPGDLNQDGVVNSLDVQLCTNVLLGVEANPAIVEDADLNGR